MADNKLELSIAGLFITVCTPEDPDYTLELANKLDGDIRSILSASDGASVTSSAILCAIDYLNNEKKASKSADNMRNQIKDYLAEAAAAKLEAEDERRRSADLTAEIQTLRSQMTRLAVDSDSSLNDRIQAQLNATTNELVTLRSRINELTAMNKSANDKNESLGKMISQRDEETANLSQENNTLRSHLAKSAEIIEQQTRSIDELTAQNAASREKAEKLAKELDTLKELIMEEARRSAAAKNAREQANASCADNQQTIKKEELESEIQKIEQLKEEPQQYAVTEQLETVQTDSAETASEPYADEPLISRKPEKTETAVSVEPTNRTKAFDYDAAIDDDSYEQLDVSIIAQVSQNERERGERDEEWARMNIDEEPTVRYEATEEQPFVPAVSFDNFDRFDGRAPEDDASITAQFDAFTAASKELLTSEPQDEEHNEPDVPEMSSEDAVESPAEQSEYLDAAADESVPPEIHDEQPQLEPAIEEHEVDLFEHTVDVDHSIFDSNGSNDLSWTMNI